MLWLAALLIAGAQAYDDPNRMVTVHVAVVHAIGQDHPWGVRAGADWQLALGDHCTYGESPDCRPGVVWPIAAPGGSVTWRGGNRVAFEVDGEIGVAGLEMHHFGFAPMWAVVGRVGLRLQTPGPVPSLAFGGFLAKSFGITVHVDENTTTVLGTHGVGVRVDADTAWPFRGPLPAPTVAGGLWLAVGGAFDYQ